MTSVPQLPLEAASAQALPKNETPRGRADKTSEEGGEGGFAAVLARAVPELARAAKAALGVASKSLQVEGEGIPAQEGEMLAVADAREAEQPGGAVKTATPTLVALEAQLREPPAETATEKGPQLVAMTQTRQDLPVAAALAAGIAGEGVVVEELPEAQTVEVDEAPRQQAPRQPSENSAQTRELTAEEGPTSSPIARVC
jgi:hypothetical protein